MKLHKYRGSSISSYGPKLASFLRANSQPNVLTQPCKVPETQGSIAYYNINNRIGPHGELAFFRLQKSLWAVRVQLSGFGRYELFISC